jgi:hypothetical protein
MWLFVAAAVVWFASMGDGGNPIDGALTFLNSITRGARLTRAPADDEGYVDADPQALADQAGLTIDQYALARMIASEEPHSDNVTKGAIAWCTVNEAARVGKTISALLLRAKNPTNNGHFGSQKDKDSSSARFGKSDRYATTALDPYDGEGQIAVAVLDGTIVDITNGCQQFDRPAEEKHPDRVAQNRVNKEHAEMVDVPGTDPGLRFWRT